MDRFTKIRLVLKSYLKQILTITLVFLAITFAAKLISNIFDGDAAFSKPIINKDNRKSVISTKRNPSTKLHEKTENVVNEFMKACNSYDFQKAYTYISDTNKKYFGTYSNFERYLKKIFNEQKRYELRAYSNVEDIDIYQLRLFSDILATGLTKQKFNYLDLKIATKLDKTQPNGLMFNVEGYIKDEKLKSVFENDDIRMDFIDTKILYKSEIIQAEIQNKTDKVLIIKDFESKIPEITTRIGNEDRAELRKNPIILKPYQKQKVFLEFFKFADDGRKITNIKLNDIRFVDEYTKDINKLNKDGTTKYINRYTLDIKLR